MIKLIDLKTKSLGSGSGDRGVSHVKIDLPTYSGAPFEQPIRFLNNFFNYIEAIGTTEHAAKYLIEQALRGTASDCTPYKKPESPLCPEIQIKIGSVPTTALLDTGSKLTCVSSEFYERYIHEFKDYPTFPLTGIKAIGFIGEKSISLKKQFRARVELQSLSIDFNFIVIPKLISPYILGIDFQDHLGAVIDLRNNSAFFVHPESSTTVECDFLLRDFRVTDRNEVNALLAVSHHDLDHDHSNVPSLNVYPVEESDTLTDAEINEKLKTIAGHSEAELLSLGGINHLFRVGRTP
ncbi:hypothetical protein TSAR_014800 [Trichomalopsis sarcophagae]|uniref:Retropepsins domain-containing protein n=1 Tax=Trichomalopsis sarcophagae TaxID=543379 RepID=A0A232ESS2_9HYME|nr:hypothetical protein TSAR_014800 [Trichomalopsis sarcophagae]